MVAKINSAKSDAQRARTTNSWHQPVKMYPQTASNAIGNNNQHLQAVFESRGLFFFALLFSGDLSLEVAVCLNPTVPW